MVRLSASEVGIGVPSTAVIMSPCTIPAAAAVESGTTLVTRTPSAMVSRFTPKNPRRGSRSGAAWLAAIRVNRIHVIHFIVFMTFLRAYRLHHRTSWLLLRGEEARCRPKLRPCEPELRNQNERLQLRALQRSFKTQAIRIPPRACV